MEIVYPCPEPIYSPSASSIHVMKMCQAFANNGHDVTLLFPEQMSKPINPDSIYEYYDVDDNFRIIEVDRSFGHDLRIIGPVSKARSIARKAAQLEPDLLYGKNLFACYFATRYGISVGYESHFPRREARFGRVQDLVLSRLIQRSEFQALVVISEGLREYYTDQYPGLESDIFVAEDGADPVDESIQPIDSICNSDRFQVGYIGSLYEGRGIELILEAASNLQEIEFHVIGGDDKEVRHWLNKTEELDNATFHGFHPPNELDQYRLAFDVLLAPYQRDLETRSGYNTLRWMSPLKIFEYMAAGRPIIASDLRAIREVLTHEETALLCNPDDVDDWVTAIQRVQSDPHMGRKLGELAKKEFLSEYTWEARARKILNNMFD